MDVYENIRKSGHELPPNPSRKGTYKPVKQIGNLLYTPGQGATGGGQPVVSGKPGGERTIEEDQEAARICILSTSSVLREYLGDLNKVKSIVKILAFVTSAPGFSSQPAVVNDASQLLKGISDDDNRVGAHSIASAIELPGNTSVEIGFIFEI